MQVEAKVLPLHWISMLDRVFLQYEVRKGWPYSIPGKVISVRENGHSAFVWCPGKTKNY